MFDAGAIQATLSVDTAKADADLRKIEDRVKRLEDEPHKIKISAVFDDASMGRARAAFASLDQAISRDAMQRLRSSPQGSVLGALNALFSPHPVSGAPSPQQAASQGLLGRMFAPQGGGNTPVSGGAGSTARNIVTGQNAPQKVTVTTQGGGTSPQATRDLENAAAAEKAAADDLSGAAGTSRDAAGRLRDASGRFASAADKAGQAADDQSAAARDLSGAAGGVRGVFDSLRKLFGGGGGAGGSGGGGAAGGAGRFAAGLAGGIGPGILGVGAKTGLITAGAGSLLGALPALVGGISPLLAAAPGLAGLGALAAGSVKQVSPLLQAQSAAQQALSVATTPAQAQAAQQQLQGVNQAVGQLSKPLQSVFKSINQIQNAWQALSGSFAPVIARGLSSVASLFQSLLPDLRQFFSASATLMQPLIGGLGDIAKSLLPLFTQAIRAAAPEIRPLLDGLGKLVSGIFPGLITLVKASAPAVTALAQVLGTLGSDIGKMFATFAPVLKQSVLIFQPLLDVISALFPIIGKLAAVFASALGPVFAQFGSVIQSLLPALTVIGKVLGALAGAVLGDLVSAFTAVAQLIKGISPALTAFAGAFSQIFTVLENTGVFAVLGDALENLAGPLAKLVSALLNGLTPILPPVIQFISQLSSVMVQGLTQAITAILPGLTQLATVALQSLAIVLPVILPVLTKVLTLFTQGVADAISAVAIALSAIIKAIPPSVLEGIVIGIAAIVGAVKAWTIAQAALDIALNANPVALVVIAVAALATAFYELWQKSAGFRQGIKDIGAGFVEVGIIVEEAVRDITSAFLSLVGTIIHGAADAFGWVPGLGSALRGAAANFDKFKAGVSNNYDQMITKLQGWQSELIGGQQTMDSTSAAIVADLAKSGMATDTARQAVANYTTAIQQNGSTSTQAQSARARLIQDLENAGYSAQQAQKLVGNLTTAIGNLRGKNIQITMGGTGSYTIAESLQNPAGGYRPTPSGNAAGGPITQGTGPTADDVPIMASKDEWVIKASSSNKYGPAAMNAVNQGTAVIGYAQGGPVGGNLTPGYITGMYGNFQAQMTASMVSAMQAALKAAEAASAAAAKGGGAAGGNAAVPSGGVAALMKSMAAARGWTGAEWTALNNVEVREAGYSLTAQNPSSGAYGLAQFINGPSEYAQYGGNSTTAAGQITAMLNYIAQRYGDPIAAWAHEQAYGWYKSGGMVGGFYGGGRLPTQGGQMPGQGGWGARYWFPPAMTTGTPVAGGGAGTPDPLAGTAFVGNYTGVVSPSSGGFGITRTQLGLPPPAPASSSSASSAGTGTGTGTSTGTTAATPAAKPAQTAAQKAAIAVLEHLMGGLIWHNQTGEASQANTLLGWLGVSKYNSQLGHISQLDSLLLSYRKAKNTKAEKATEQLLTSFGVRAFNPVAGTHGNAPKMAVVSKLESLIASDITANSMTAAGQANALLTHLGISKYSHTLSQINQLDALLGQYKAKKDKKDIAAVETLLRTYGVKKFAQGGTLWEPVIGFGQQSGGVYQFAEHGPETVTPMGGGGSSGDVGAKLDRLCMLMEKQIQTTASVPHGVTSGIGSALGGAAQSAAHAARYPRGGW